MWISWYCCLHTTYFIDLLTIDCSYVPISLVSDCLLIHISLYTQCLFVCRYQVSNKKLPLTFNTCFLDPEITTASAVSHSAKTHIMRHLIAHVSLYLPYFYLYFLFIIHIVRNFHAITNFERNSAKQEWKYNKNSRFLFRLVLDARHKQPAANVMFGREKTAGK